MQTSYCAHFVRPQRKGSDRDTKRSISAVGRAKPRPSISVDCIIDLLVKHLCQVIKSKRSGTSTWPFHFLPSYDVHESVLAWTVIHWLHWLFESHRSRKIMFELSLFRGFQFLTFGNSQSSPWDFGPQRSERPFLPQLPGFALGGEGMIAAEKGSPLKLHLKQKLIMTLKRRMPLPGKHQVAGYERPKRTSLETQPQMIPTVNLQPWYSVKRHDVIILSICKIFAFDVSSISDEWLATKSPKLSLAISLQAVFRERLLRS